MPPYAPIARASPRAVQMIRAAGTERTKRLRQPIEERRRHDRPEDDRQPLAGQISGAEIDEFAKTDGRS